MKKILSFLMIFKNLTFLGSLILLISFLFDWVIYKDITNKIDDNIRLINDYHYLELIHQLDLNTVYIVDSCKIKHKSDCINLAQIKHDAVFSFLQTLPFDKKEKKRIIGEFDSESLLLNVQDYNSYKTYVDYCSRKINEYKGKFYENVQILKDKEIFWGFVFRFIYVIGTILIIIGEYKKQKAAHNIV